MKSVNVWGSNTTMVDDTALLLGGDGKRCRQCRRVTKCEFLENDLCPDCFQEQHGKPSPALERSNTKRSSFYASGEAGEAD